MIHFRIFTKKDPNKDVVTETQFLRLELPQLYFVLVHKATTTELFLFTPSTLKNICSTIYYLNLLLRNFNLQHRH